MRHYVALAKPGITGLVTLTTGVGYVCAAGALLEPGYFVQVLLATALLSSGAAATNQIIERKYDARMTRTRGRPLVSGALSKTQAAAFAVVCAGGGGLLALMALPRFSTILLYTCYISYIAYTLLKRRTCLCTLVGGIPGALPVLVGWTATGASITPTALALVGSMYIWQMPHFLAIGWLCRTDYARAGFRVLSAFDSDGRMSARISVAYAFALIPVSLIPFVTGAATVGYFVAAALTGATFLVFAERFARLRSVRSARALFMSSLAYIPVTFTALLFFRG